MSPAEQPVTLANGLGYITKFPTEFKLVQAPPPNGQLVLLPVPAEVMLLLAALVEVVICIEVPVRLACTAAAWLSVFVVVVVVPVLAL